VAKNSIIRPEDPTPTEKQIDTICLWISKGAIIDTALAAAGIPKTLYNRWLRAGVEGMEPYATYKARVEAALVLFECALLTTISTTAKNQANAAQWLFLLRFGPKYKRAADQEAGLETQLPATVQQLAEVSEEELEAAERRALEAGRYLNENKPRAFGLEPPKLKH
jgi:hypothetical protein